jgi:5,10-methylenetetrahydromethanopterin reductase
MPRYRFGVRFTLSPPPDAVEVVKYAEARGADCIFTVEGRLATDGVTPLAMYLGHTSRIRLGTGILPLWTRHVVTLAQTFATMDLYGPGRMILGLGAWWEPLATRVGVKRERPLRAMRETIEALRLLFRRDRPVTYHGDFVHLDGAFLDHAGLGRHDVKLYIGAGGPEMRRLAGAVADGVVLNGKQTLEVTRRAIQEVREGAIAAGRRPEDVEIVKPLTIVLTPDKRAAILAERPILAQYIAQQPHIGVLMEADPDLVARLRELLKWPTSPAAVQEAGTLVPPELIERMGCYGEADEVRERIDRFMALGADVLLWDSSSPAPARQILDFLADGR